ncbi:MAG: Asp-tRNA(Asn)/Glu-tRNA(Gln) amidotransferase subunit GatC [Clostridiales bacterium]|nr:Asp-tRNA(Asn)/Glu-tRNA(Gln) amidotransferase subunit GatC [Clostridiales bacterium]
MNGISDEEVKHIAKLSAIGLSEKEMSSMKKHLSAVLDYFKTLDKVDVSGVSPTAHILSAVNVLREDTPRESMPTDELMKTAPDSDGSSYTVPRVVE